jgi:hypothetical protein
MMEHDGGGGDGWGRCTAGWCESPYWQTTPWQMSPVTSPTMPWASAGTFGPTMNWLPCRGGGGIEMTMNQMQMQQMHVEQIRRQQMLMQQTSMQWTPAPQPMQHMHVAQMHRQQMLMQQMPMQWTPAPQMPMQQMPMQQMAMQEMHTQKMHMHLQRMLMQQPMPQTHAQHMPMPQEGAPDAVVQQQLCDLFDAWATADASQAELVQSVQHCALRWPLDNQRLQHVIQNQTLVCAALKVILTRREQEQTAAPDDVDEGGEARSPASTLAAEEAGNAVCAETPGASPVQAQADTATEGFNAEPNPQIEPARTAQGLLPGENTALSPPQLTKDAHTGPQASWRRL